VSFGAIFPVLSEKQLLGDVFGGVGRGRNDNSKSPAIRFSEYRVAYTGATRAQGRAICSVSQFEQ
jgi:hypothetical protein